MNDLNPTAAPTRTPVPGLMSRLLGYLEGDPDNTTLRGDIFDLALAAGQFEAAQEQVAWVLGRHPADPRWRHRRAVLSMAQQHWPEADQLLRGLIAEGQDDPAIAYNLAYVDYSQDHLDQAAARLAPLVDVHLDRVPEALALWLRCLHRQGRVDDGLALFRRHDAPAPAPVPSPSAFGVASLLAVDADQIELAGRWADSALARDARQREALVAKGTALLATRDVQGALQHLQAAQQQHADDGRTWSALGMAHLLVPDLVAAHDAFTRALRLMPSHIGTWHGLGWCEILRQDLAAAHVAFDAALALNRNFGESHGGLAVVLALQGGTAESEASIRRALKLSPGSLSARFAQAVLSGDLHDTEKFSRLAREALSQHPGTLGKTLADLVLSPMQPSTPGRPRA